MDGEILVLLMSVADPACDFGSPPDAALAPTGLSMMEIQTRRVHDLMNARSDTVQLVFAR